MAHRRAGADSAPAGNCWWARRRTAPSPSGCARCYAPVPHDAEAKAGAKRGHPTARAALAPRRAPENRRRNALETRRSVAPDSVEWNVRTAANACLEDESPDARRRREGVSEFRRKRLSPATPAPIERPSPADAQPIACRVLPDRPASRDMQRERGRARRVLLPRAARREERSRREPAPDPRRGIARRCAGTNTRLARASHCRTRPVPQRSHRPRAHSAARPRDPACGAGGRVPRASPQPRPTVSARQRTLGGLPGWRGPRDRE